MGNALLYTARSTVFIDTSAFMSVLLIYKSKFPVNMIFDVSIAITLSCNFLWTSNIDVLPVRNFQHCLKNAEGFSMLESSKGLR